MPDTAQRRCLLDLLATFRDGQKVIAKSSVDGTGCDSVHANVARADLFGETARKMFERRLRHAVSHGFNKVDPGGFGRNVDHTAAAPQRWQQRLREEEGCARIELKSAIV